jgi:Uma2 family endonuclease
MLAIPFEMSAAANKTESKANQKITLNGLTWKTYKALMSEVACNRLWRIAYDRRVLEIRMPSTEHEEPKVLIANFITAFADALNIEIRELGALTLEREDLNRAVEPDTCFYIQNELNVRGRSINLSQDPPPDLAIESDYTNSSIDKLSIYAMLGVPELWRYQQNSLTVYCLKDGKYERSLDSIVLANFPISEISDLIAQSNVLGQRAVVRLFRNLICDRNLEI